ncbi:hypothetical protein C5S30_05065 [ANME-1 cluster archaeon GoMg4]|nr:hypothetical protein [ANME-1 cluster archaeon GoMg4]
METKYVNECNEEIPDYIISKAMELGCVDHSCIYKKGEYGGKLPKASIGCRKATRFRNASNAESMKVPLGDGWVAFKYPSGKGSNSSSKSKAEKHTSILCQVEDIFESLHHPNYEIYLAHHTEKNKGYPAAEKDCENRAFYSLRMYSTSEPKRNSFVGEPDCIVIKRQGENYFIRYVIEVKWGYLEGYPGKTDLKSIFDENVISMIRNSKVCRAKGPYIQNGDEVNEKKALPDFKVYSNTKFLVVSDLRGLRESNLDIFTPIKNQYENYDNLFSICDIKEDVDTFYSLDAFLKKQK